MIRERRTIGIWLSAFGTAGFVAGCGEEPPPTSVPEFMENPILLEATMVRCVQNRAEARYDAECMNAREAVDRIAAAEEEARRADLEAQSERKRQALRRAQEAAAEARRQAQEAERRREEAEYLGQFEPLPEAGDGEAEDPNDDRGGAGQAPPGGEMPGAAAAPGADSDRDSPSPPAAPTATAAPLGQAPDLDSIRRELGRRQAEADAGPVSGETPRQENDRPEIEPAENERPEN